MTEYSKRVNQILEILKPEPEEYAKLKNHIEYLTTYNEDTAIAFLTDYIINTIPLAYSSPEIVGIYAALLGTTPNEVYAMQEELEKFFKAAQIVEYAKNTQEITYGIAEKRTLFGLEISKEVRSDAIAEIYKLNNNTYYLEFGDMATWVQTIMKVNGEIYSMEFYNRGQWEAAMEEGNLYTANNIQEFEIIKGPQKKFV